MEEIALRVITDLYFDWNFLVEIDHSYFTGTGLAWNTLKLGNMRIETAMLLLPALHRCTPDLWNPYWLPRKPSECSVLPAHGAHHWASHKASPFHFRLLPQCVCFCALFAVLYPNHSQGNFFQDFSFPFGYSSLSDVNVVRFNSPSDERKHLYKFLFLQIYQPADSKKSSC